MGFRLTPRAEADIEAIALHIAANDPTAALRWYEGILTRCRRLGESPGMGPARPDIRPGLRIFPVGNYLILYEQVAEGADIIRVVHGAREWQDLL